MPSQSSDAVAEMDNNGPADSQPTQISGFRWLPALGYYLY